MVVKRVLPIFRCVQKAQKGGGLGESNSRPLRPERRIIPLDQTPAMKIDTPEVASRWLQNPSRNLSRSSDESETQSRRAVVPSRPLCTPAHRVSQSRMQGQLLRTSLHSAPEEAGETPGRRSAVTPAGGRLRVTGGGSGTDSVLRLRSGSPVALAL